MIALIYRSVYLRFQGNRCINLEFCFYQNGRRIHCGCYCVFAGSRSGFKIKEFVRETILFLNIFFGTGDEQMLASRFGVKK